MKQSTLPIIIVVVLAVLAGGYVLMNQNKSGSDAMMEKEDTMMEQVQEAGSSSDAMMGDDAMMEKTSGDTMMEDKDGAMMEDNEAKEFTLTASNYKYDVKEIRVKKGDTVKIVLKNAQGFHDWMVDEFKAATKQISEGQEDTVTFVADKVGEFEYYCSVGQHRANGMVGTLIVEE